MRRMDEGYIIGSLVTIKTSELHELIEEVSEDMFEDPRNKFIYNIMLALYKRGDLPDIISIVPVLEKKDRPELVDYLLQLGEECLFFRSNFNLIVKQLKSNLYIRRVKQAAHAITRMTEEPLIDIEVLQTESEALLLKAAQEAQALKPKCSSAIEGLRSVAENMIDNWENQGGLKGVTSGFQIVDQSVHGFRKGEVTIMAGRPSTGKTAMAMNMIIRSIIKSDISALFFSVEMTKESLQERSIMFGIAMNGAENDRRQVDDGGYAPPVVIRDGVSRLEQVLENRLFIDDTSMLNEAQLRSRVGRAIIEHNIGLVCIDYLQIMQYSGKAETRQVMVTNLSQSIKAIAKDFKVPILCLSQLNRSSGDSGEPHLCDLRDSGAIEQDADVVLMLWRPENDLGHTYMKVAKNRNGKPAKIEFTFDAVCYNFVAQRDVTGQDLTLASGFHAYD